MPGRFEDPAVERAYVEGERRARIPGTRFLAAMGMVTLISYIGFNPLHFPREGVIAYNIAAAVFLTFLAGVIGLTFTRFYIACGWIDIVIFSALGVAMIMLIDALGDQAAITGISRFGMAIVNLGILVVFAAVGFVATTRYFLAWATLVVVLYLAFLIQADRGIVNKVYTFTNFTTFLTFAAFVNWDIDRRARKTFAAQRALDIERQKTEDLLFNVLPPAVAQRLREGQAVADSFSDVSVVFIDIVGFSQLARRLPPACWSRSSTRCSRSPTAAPIAAGWRRSRPSAMPISRLREGRPRAIAARARRSISAARSSVPSAVSRRRPGSTSGCASASTPARWWAAWSAAAAMPMTIGATR